MNTPVNQELADQYGVTALDQQTRVSTEALNKLTKLIEDGIVTVHVDKTYPLEEITAAFEARENGSVRGKVVLTIQ
jgi:NADPH:quinone reductase-like Zn-dependent oxidoreductase